MPTVPRAKSVSKVEIYPREGTETVDGCHAIFAVRSLKFIPVRGRNITVVVWMCAISLKFIPERGRKHRQTFLLQCCNKLKFIPVRGRKPTVR